MTAPAPMLEVSSAAETDSEQTENETIKLADFLEEWGDTLKAQVLRNMQPVYSGKTEDEWDRQARGQLQNLLRTAFPGQITKGILPVAKAFYHADNKAAFLVGEMGAGKVRHIGA